MGDRSDEISEASNSDVLKRMTNYVKELGRIYDSLQDLITRANSLDVLLVDILGLDGRQAGETKGRKVEVSTIEEVVKSTSVACNKFLEEAEDFDMETVVEDGELVKVRIKSFKMSPLSVEYEQV